LRLKYRGCGPPGHRVGAIQIQAQSLIRLFLFQQLSLSQPAVRRIDLLVEGQGYIGMVKALQDPGETELSRIVVGCLLQLGLIDRLHLFVTSQSAQRSRTQGQCLGVSDPSQRLQSVTVVSGSVQILGYGQRILSKATHPGESIRLLAQNMEILGIGSCVVSLLFQVARQFQAQSDRVIQGQRRSILMFRL
jgi:hypothetical protein